MFKKILLIIGSVFIGLNLGMISCASPVYIILGFAISGDTSTEIVSFAVYGLITAVISGIATYIYTYKKRREHEPLSPYVMSLAWSFFAGAVIAVCALFIYSGYAQYRI